MTLKKREKIRIWKNRGQRVGGGKNKSYGRDGVKGSFRNEMAEGGGMEMEVQIFCTLYN